MRVTTRLQRESISVLESQCDLGPADTPFVEQHERYSVSYLHEGSFGCRAQGQYFELVAGSTFVGQPGDEYLCTHDHLQGDESLSVYLSPNLVASIGDEPALWRTGRAASAARADRGRGAGSPHRSGSDRHRPGGGSAPVRLPVRRGRVGTGVEPS